MVGFAEKNCSYQKNANSENGRVGKLRREKCQKNTHSENGRVGGLCTEKYKKRMGIPKTVGLADLAEENAKRMGMEF